MLVDLVEVDRLHPEPPGAPPGPLEDDGTDGEDGEDLAGDEGLLPVAPEGPAEDPLGPAEGIGLGRVEQRDPHLEGLLDDPAGVVLGVVPAVAPLPGAELPGPETDGRHPGPADLHVPHDVPGSITWGASGSHRRGG